MLKVGMEKSMYATTLQTPLLLRQQNIDPVFFIVFRVENSLFI